MRRSPILPMGDLVPFVQFKKREKRPWRIINFSKAAATLLKIRFLYVCFLRFLNWENVTKWRKA